MPERWLPSDDRLVRYDAAAEQLRVSGWQPGPAGVSAVDLADGLRVAVDHASPTTLSEVAIDLVRGRIADEHLELLANLLGAEAVDRLQRLPGGRGDRRPVRLTTPRDDVAVRRDRDEHAAFARMVLCADLGEDARLADELRPLALLEAAGTAFDIHRALALDLAGRGLGVLQEVGGPQDAIVASHLASILHTIAGRAGADALAGVASRAAQRLTGAAEARRRAIDGALSPMAAAAAAPRPPLAMPLAAPAREAAPPRAERPLPVGGDHRGWAWLDAGSNVAVRAAGRPHGAWARVFRASDRLLLGLSPVRAGDDRSSEALVVIPPTPAGDLRVDIVDDAATPLRAPTHDQVRRAIEAGRDAARLSRLGAGGADQAWAVCAAAWDDLGDTQRANLARRHGRREPGTAPRGRSAPILPLLVDGFR